MLVETVNPATGTGLATYPAQTWDDISADLDAARNAFLTWSDTPVADRLALLEKVGGLLTDRRDEYAALVTAEMGKPITEALAEIDKCALNCQVVADLAVDWLADHPVASSAQRSWLRYEPLGVVFAVMPWNFPFWQVLALRRRGAGRGQRGGAQALTERDGLRARHRTAVSRRRRTRRAVRQPRGRGSRRSRRPAPGSSPTRGSRR